MPEKNYSRNCAFFRWLVDKNAKLCDLVYMIFVIMLEMG